jgi:hypothetical protein
MRRVHPVGETTVSRFARLLPLLLLLSAGPSQAQEDTSGTETVRLKAVDIRLKAFRDGEQLIEYLSLLAGKYNLTRDQMRAVVFAAATIEGGLLPFAAADNADAIRFNLMKDWQIAGIRRAVAQLIVEKK